MKNIIPNSIFSIFSPNHLTKGAVLKTFFCFCVLVLLTLSSTGCAIVRMGPGGVPPGSFFGNVTYPNELNPRMEHELRLTGEDINVIGPVDAEGTSHNVLGLASWGDSGFGVLLEEARERGGDGVMNVSVDTRFTRVGILFIDFYTGVTTKLCGVAYKYKRR